MDIRHLSATISERVVNYLEQEIIEGRLAPGQRLIEDEVAARLGVSRSPVREAFRVLEHRGLAVALPRKGAFVRPLDPEEIADLYTLQASVTGLMGRLAAERRRPEDVEALQSVVANMAAAAEAADALKFLACFVDFTRALTRAARSTWIEKALTTWEKTILRYGYLALSVPGYIDAALERYRAALAAIEAGDAARAEEVLRTSIEAGGRRIADHLTRRG
jgi:DNA-binding GntR family transcriptional regulator